MDLAILILRVILTLYLILMLWVSTKHLKPRIGSNETYLIYLRALKLRNKKRLKDHYYLSVLKTFIVQVSVILLIAFCVAKQWFYFLSLFITIGTFLEVILLFKDYELKDTFTWKDKVYLGMDRLITLVSYAFNWISLITLILTV